MTRGPVLASGRPEEKGQDHRPVRRRGNPVSRKSAFWFNVNR